MSVTVYIWLPHNGNVGHASMELPDGTYISWWPEGKDSAKGKKDKGILNWAVSPAVIADDLDDDIASEDDRNPVVHKVPVPKVANIKAWWTKNKYGTYVVLGKNCCDVVINALNAGGFKDAAKGLPSTPTKLASQLKSYKQ